MPTEVTLPPSAQLPVIAVDGPSGSGKSSVSKAVARELGLRYLDTGAMYRAATLAMLQAEVDLADAAAVAAQLADVQLESITDPDHPSVMLNGQNVDGPIREADVTSSVSAVSAVPQVRAEMVAKQRQAVADAVAAGNGIVVEGRDIGTTVLPDAPLKIFLTASAAARAARRTLQDESEGRSVNEDTEAALKQRDKADSSRAASPLTQAEDAIVIDATDLTFDQVVAKIVELAGKLLQ